VGGASVIVSVIFSVFVWFVVWYLASSISDAVRRRDFELASANARLRKADEEKNQQMLRVTHDLKAPFSGIESSIHVLKHIHWDQLPEAVQQIIDKIAVRSETLRSRIGEILMLGSLRTGISDGKADSETDLTALLGDVIGELKGLASERMIKVTLKAVPVTVHIDRRQLRILFTNLISNAISYSSADGVVDVTVSADDGISVVVSDHGIGIKPDAIPHIFEDFYHSPEAVAVNPKSTGLGLAIVRQVAQNLRLAIDVSSELGEGTSIGVRIPT